MLIFYIFTHPFNESFIFLVFLVFFPHAHQKFHKEQALRLFLFEYSTIQTQERLEVEFNLINLCFLLQGLNVNSGPSSKSNQINNLS